MAGLTGLKRADEVRLKALMAKGAWTNADVDELLELTAVHTLWFPAGTYLPPGALGRLSPLIALRVVVLDNCPVGDGDIAQLAQAVPELKWLHLTRTNITDTALATIGANFARLEQLHIGQTALTDRGLPFLASLSHLKYLWVDGTAVSDAGLLTLAPARLLNVINTQGTAVTPAGKEAHFRAWLVARRGAKAIPPAPADVAACHSVLTDFFDAMNDWEQETHRLNATAVGMTELQAGRSERQRLVAEIFARFLVPGPRKGERDQALRVQKPLTYSTVQFFDAERVSRDKVNIITKEGSAYRLYLCVRTPDGWRIEAKKWLDGSGWRRDYF